MSKKSATKAAAAPAPNPIAPSPTELISAQTDVILAEIRVIESQATRGALIASDNTSLLLAKVEEALKSGQVEKTLLEELRTRLETQSHAVLVAILSANLSARLNNGDLAPKSIAGLDAGTF